MTAPFEKLCVSGEGVRPFGASDATVDVCVRPAIICHRRCRCVAVLFIRLFRGGSPPLPAPPRIASLRIPTVTAMSMLRVPPPSILIRIIVVPAMTPTVMATTMGAGVVVVIVMVPPMVVVMMVRVVRVVVMPMMVVMVVVAMGEIFLFFVFLSNHLARSFTVTARKIHLEPPVMQHRVMQMVLRIGRVIWRLELHVGETAWPLRVVVTRNVNVKERAEFLESVPKVFGGRLVGNVADEKGSISGSGQGHRLLVLVFEPLFPRVEVRIVGHCLDSPYAAVQWLSQSLLLDS